MVEDFVVKYLGVQDYESVFSAQQQFTRNRCEHDPDELWVVAHPPVFTSGQAGTPEHVLHAAGIRLVRSERRVQATFPCPAQARTHPLLHLSRL